MVDFVVPPIPPELCGWLGCALTPHPAGTLHSWADRVPWRPKYRILVTGSREWPGTAEGIAIIDEALTDACFEATATRLDVMKKDLIIVHGGARGADTFAERWARLMSIKSEVHPADWKQGTHAGRDRNLKMVASGIDVVLAFWSHRSPGTFHCINTALEAGLPVQIFDPVKGRTNP